MAARRKPAPTFLEGRISRPFFQLLGQLLADAVRHLAPPPRRSRKRPLPARRPDEPGQRLLVQSLAHIGGENFLKFLLDFLAEGQDRVTLGLLGAELGAGF